MDNSQDKDNEPVCKKARLEADKNDDLANTDKDGLSVDVGKINAPCEIHSLDNSNPDDSTNTNETKNSNETSADKNRNEAKDTLIVESDVVSVQSTVSSDATVKNSIGCASANGEKSVPTSQVSDGTFGVKPLTEIEAGITEYRGCHQGFSAIIKQRYSDFNVNEVDLAGNVVHLTDLSIPEDEAQDADVAKEIDTSVIEQVYKEKLEALINSGEKSGFVNIPAPDDKELRTKIHLAVKKAYPKVETKTQEADGLKVIHVFLRKGGSVDSRDGSWPASKKNCGFVKFVLYKENKDTMDAIGLISKLMKIKEGVFQYAGTKDKRARTSQEITAKRVHPKKLSFLNKLLRNMGVGNFCYVENPMKLGELSGNQFTIVLRNVTSSNEVVDQALNSMISKGFINYYGMQRFGTTSVPTHKVGSALLHSDWKKAVDLILMPRENGEPAKAKFQKIWHETGDASKTLKEVPRFCGLERNLLDGLAKNMRPLNALDRISRNTRLLYVHSYQAYVWNRMVSRRLVNLGHEPVIGDLVIPRGDNTSDKAEPLVVTEANKEKYTIHDVVLPLPGHSIAYPHNQVKTWYKDTLKDDGLDIDDLKRPQKDYSLPGSYRHVTVLPKDITWTYRQYSDYTEPLTLSDWDVLNGTKLPEPCSDGKFKAVVLQMTLPLSCYATMALREVLKTDTSAAHQTSLNVT